MHKAIFASTVLYLVTISIVLYIKELSHAYYGPDLGVVCNYLLFAATVLLYILQKVTPEFKISVFRSAVAGTVIQYLAATYLVAGAEDFGTTLSLCTIATVLVISVQLTRPKSKEADDEHTGC